LPIKAWDVFELFEGFKIIPYLSNNNINVENINPGQLVEPSKHNEMKINLEFS
jgi:hypothetical protein